MNITLVVSSLGSGGAERVLAGLANYWVQFHNVTIVTYLEKTEFYRLDKRVVRKTAVANNSKNKAINFVKRLKNIRQAIKNSKPDVVLSFVDRCNVLTLVATKGLNLNVIVAERTNPIYYTIGKSWEILRRITYPFASRIVIQTADIQPWAEKFKPSKDIFVIPNAIDKERAQLIETVKIENLYSTLPFEKNIIAIGRLSHEKGCDQLLKAFAKVHHDIPGWGLNIVGDGILRQSMQALAEQLNISSKVKFHGNQNNPFIALNMADLFVLPSRVEGFPNVLLEAMAMGKACISFNCPSGPSELITDKQNGLLIEKENIQALGEAITLLANNSKLRETYARQASISVKKFNEAEVMNQWDKVIGL